MPFPVEIVEFARHVASLLAGQGALGVERTSLVALATRVEVPVSVHGPGGAGEPAVVLVRDPTPRGASVSVGADTCFRSLTAREREVADLVASGCSNAEIAARLRLSVATVKDHVHRILYKSGLTSRTAMAAAWHA